MTRLDVEFDPRTPSNADRVRGDTGNAGYMLINTRRFANRAAPNFVYRFKVLMAAHGVVLVANEKNVPVLSVHPGSTSTNCAPVCHTRVEIVGNLRDEALNRDWGFSSSLIVEDMDDVTFDKFVRGVVDAMVKDGLVEPALVPKP